jgi:5-oxoprolinase (ATP-hydrolysing)
LFPAFLSSFVATEDLRRPGEDPKKNQEPPTDKMSNGTAAATAAATAGDGKFHFAIDRGGTFTDVFCILPDGTARVSKLLSEDPAHYPDAPTEGIRRILEQYDVTTTTTMTDYYSRGQPVSTRMIGSIRMGTTVATNALLERDGAKMAFLVTAGFADILEIGNQARPNIFDLTCAKPGLLYETVVPVRERILLRQFTPASLHGRYPSHVGITGEQVLVEQEPDLDQVRQDLIMLRDRGITALAVCLLHAYIYPDHELRIGQLAASLQCFEQISLSHQVMPMVKLVSRGHTAAAAAYLTPKIATYLSNFVKGFDEGIATLPLTFMKSDGGLAPVHDFGGHQAILSGPAGGVVGYAKTAYQTAPVIGFDMGGTSTDVSRYDGHWGHVFETVTAGIAIQAPQLDIHTVAAGGGSRLFLKRGMFIVGPESARAHPGPVCYRKNGYLAVTDANVVLGRVIPDLFPKIFGPHENEPLDVQGAWAAFEELTRQPEAQGRSVEELAYGFVQVANEAMVRLFVYVWCNRSEIGYTEYIFMRPSNSKCSQEQQQQHKSMIYSVARFAI